MSILFYILAGILLTNEIVENNERQQSYKQARMVADHLGKPLLVVGVPKRIRDAHPPGDITIDISSNVPTDIPYQVADVRNIPYPDKYFGAVYISHVLEHLLTIEDARQAINEMHRVADTVFIAGPHKTSLTAWLHPEHKLWVTPTGDGYIVEQRGQNREAMMVRIRQ